MLDLKSVKTAFDKYSFTDLVSDYEQRQLANIQKNKQITRYFLEEFDFLKSAFSFLGNDYITQLRTLMILILNSPDPHLKSFLLEKLHEYSYHFPSELLIAMQLADSLLTGDFSYELFSTSLKGLSTMYECKYHDDKSILLDTTYGDVEFLDTTLNMGVPEIEPDLRRGYCHNVISDFLCAFPNMVGAYYYIPLQFQGFIEHSVIIDEEHNQVLDFTNNITLPLDYFKKCYPNYSWAISGKNFNGLNEFLKDEYGETLNMAILEEVRRVRVKR